MGVSELGKMGDGRLRRKLGGAAGSRRWHTGHKRARLGQQRVSRERKVSWTAGREHSTHSKRARSPVTTLTQVDLLDVLETGEIVDVDGMPSGLELYVSAANSFTATTGRALVCLSWISKLSNPFI